MDNDHTMLTRSKTTTIISDINLKEESVKQKNINSKVNSIFPTTPTKSKKKNKRNKRRKTRSPSFIIEEDVDCDSGDGEGEMLYSKQSTFKFITDNILNMKTELNLMLEEDIEDDDSVDYDDQDEKFMEICDDGMFEDKNFEYFHNLTVGEKKTYIKSIEKLKQINSDDIPLKFKVLKSFMPEHTKAYALSLIDKIEGDSESSEIHKINKWVEGLISIPFSQYIPMFPKDETHDDPVKYNAEYITKVHKCLNGAIFGHQEAKFHIIQLVAKWLRNPESTGNVIAIQGPMGNGKTTLVKEGIAKALNRPFAFVSLGGSSDSAYLSGHSMTYEGSIWGRIADILIKSKCMNPIIYFDELDKVSDTTKGEEIINLLTHITDFSQNDRFQDNYFSGIDIDLSKVLFIFSFNDETKVNRILKDRMYVINTKGFKVKEKIKISNEYLLPKLYDSFKFSPEDIIFPANIIEHIIDRYTSREEGVRNLQRCLETVLSKLNMYNMYIEPSEETSKESSKETSSSDLDIPFKIKDFKLPYILTIETINTLLKVNNKNTPPEHMYL